MAAIINSIFAMKCLGYSDDHPALANQLREIEKLVVYEEDKLLCYSHAYLPLGIQAWAIALLESGIPSTHPALQRAGEWLLSKEVRNFGDWALKCKVEEPSGWYFRYANEFYPDTDDSAAVLMALQRISLPEAAHRERPFYAD